MIHFANPSAFLLLPLFAGLVWLREWQSSRYHAALPFPDRSLVDALPLPAEFYNLRAAEAATFNTLLPTSTPLMAAFAAM